MPEENKEQNPPVKEKGQEIHVTVDNEQTKILAQQLAQAQQEKKAAEDKLAKLEADKKAQDEASKKLGEETEDLKNKLGIIAEKELDKKRKAVTEQAKTLLKDDARVKEIEAKLSTPEGIAAMEYTMNVLEKSLKIGQEEQKAYVEAERKKAEEAAKVAEAAKAAGQPAPAGSAPMNAAQMGNAQPTDLMHMKFDSYQAMVRYLHEVENGSVKERAAEAKVALDELLKKWASLVKQGYDSMRGAEPMGKDQPLFKDLLKSRRAQEELKRREQGKNPENVTN